MNIEKNEREIREQLDLAEDSDLFGQSYEDGVKAALEWILGDSEESPFED